MRRTPGEVHHRGASLVGKGECGGMGAWRGQGGRGWQAGGYAWYLKDKIRKGFQEKAG